MTEFTTARMPCPVCNEWNIIIDKDRVIERCCPKKELVFPGPADPNAPEIPPGPDR